MVNVAVAFALTLVVVLLLVFAVKTSSGTSSGSTTPAQKPIPPFTGWAANGNQYVIDGMTQINMSQFNGVAPNDKNPIACPEQTLVAGKCATDLAAAGSICDSTPGCIGLVYNISDPIYPTATPVNSWPVPVYYGAAPADGFGSVFMAPLARETSGRVYFSVDTEPNTVWSANTISKNSLPVGAHQGALSNCFASNYETPNTCGGVLVPSYDSTYQQTRSNHDGLLIGIQYDTLATYAPSLQYTNAISLTYNTVP
jgi:hypothetical protein